MSKFWVTLLNVSFSWIDFLRLLVLSPFPWSTKGSETSLYLIRTNYSSTFCLDNLLNEVTNTDPSTWELIMKKFFLPTLTIVKKSHRISSLITIVYEVPSFLNLIAIKKPCWKPIYGGKYFLTVQTTNNSLVSGIFTKSICPKMKKVSKIFFSNLRPFSWMLIVS